MVDAKVTGGTLPYCLPIWNRDNYFYGVGCVQGYIVEILSSPVRTLSLLPSKITQVREHTTIYNPLSMNDHLKEEYYYHHQNQEKKDSHFRRRITAR
ncbi:MAG: hypothetical protein M3232_03870 [Thermoproteota archaeon]|nr:hypothetical protein [Thermoproteota archaeon]